MLARETPNMDATRVTTPKRESTGPVFVPAPTATLDRNARIRAALGLSGGSLPRVQIRWLHSYHEHLVACLEFPFQARYAGETWLSHRAASFVAVVSLLDPGMNPGRESSGLLCRVQRSGEEVELPLADLEVGDDSPNYQLIEDYWYWFWNWRFDPQI